MKPASKQLAIKVNPPRQLSWRPKKKPKSTIVEVKEPIQMCRIVPPLVAIIPELLDVQIPKNYTPTQAIDLLNLKIQNRLLLPT